VVGAQICVVGAQINQDLHLFPRAAEPKSIPSKEKSTKPKKQFEALPADLVELLGEDGCLGPRLLLEGRGAPRREGRRERQLLDLRCLEREFKLPWREAGPLYHHDDKVDSDQSVVNEELSRARVDESASCSTFGG